MYSYGTLYTIGLILIFDYDCEFFQLHVFLSKTECNIFNDIDM